MGTVKCFMISCSSCFEGDTYALKPMIKGKKAAPEKSYKDPRTTKSLMSGATGTFLTASP
jgi:hypothetical protein